jgi:hypothetical protein
MRRLNLAAGLFAGFLALPALADETAPPAAPPPPPQRMKGTIASYDQGTQMLSLTTPDHKTVPVTLRPNTRVVYDQKRKLADIKAGDFVGVGALKGSDGKLRAQQVVVFPEGMRGMGEGQYPMGDPTSNRLMTNASVVEVAGVTTAAGSLKLNYKGAVANPDGTCSGHAGAPGSVGCDGSADISVAKGVPVIGMVQGDTSLLVPGAAISLLVSTQPDGTLMSPALTVEKDGVKPLP